MTSGDRNAILIAAAVAAVVWYFMPAQAGAAPPAGAPLTSPTQGGSAVNPATGLISPATLYGGGGETW
jgi:hypothetical protein